MNPATLRVFAASYNFARVTFGPQPSEDVLHGWVDKLEDAISEGRTKHFVELYSECGFTHVLRSKGVLPAVQYFVKEASTAGGHPLKVTFFDADKTTDLRGEEAFREVLRRAGTDEEEIRALVREAQTVS
jgi:hypothetical protein